MLPELPSWDGLHPLVVHFPVVLLLVGPLLLIGGWFRRPGGTGAVIAALVLMTMGTVSALVSIETGKAAAEMADRTEAVMPVVADHAASAKLTTITFAILTVLTLLLAIVFERPASHVKQRIRGIAYTFLLLACLGAGLLVARTGHLGGQLVHEFGLKADLSP